MPYEEYQVVDLLNRTPETLTRRVDFEKDWGLENRPDGYLVYDFWNKRFLGHYYTNLSIELPPFSSAVLAIRPFLNRPQVLSTSRHITQGALEIKELSWNAEEGILRGVSNLTKQDLYEITFYVPSNYVPLDHSLQSQGDGIYMLSLPAGDERTEAWSLKFKNHTEC